MTSDRPRLLFAVTAPESTHFLRGQLSFFRELGAEVHLVASPGPDLVETGRLEGVAVHPVGMRRGIGVVRDLGAVARLVTVTARLRPDVVSAGTPKAGLLVTLAAAVLGVPRRVHVLHGLRSEGERGWRRRMLQWTERLTCLLAHQVVCVSHSVRDVAVHHRLVAAGKAVVIGSGSCNGIEARRYAPSPERDEAAAELRRQRDIPGAAPVVGFVGRLTRDKGLRELLAARDLLRARAGTPPTWLVIGGTEGMPVSAAHDTHVLGEIDDVAPWYRTMDLLVLPTYREGCPTVVLEAACAEVPAVVSDATGAVDSVVDDVTGRVVPVRDAAALADAIAELLDDPARRRRMGEAARLRAEESFRPEDVWWGLAASYRLASMRPCDRR